MESRLLEVLVPIFVVLVLIGVGLTVFCVIAKHAKRKRAWKRDVQYNEEYQEWMQRVDAEGGVAPIDCPLLLDQGEQCYAYKQSVSLYESRTQFKHEHSGVLLEATDGIGIGLGSTKTISFDEVRLIDKGSLSVTDRCVYFNGSKLSRAIPLNEIYSAKAAYSCLEIGARTRDAIMLFKRVNGQVFCATIRLLLEEKNT